MHIKSLSFAALLIAAASFQGAAETLTSGNWTLSTGGNTPLTLSYRGRKILSDVASGYWTSGYKASRFGGRMALTRSSGNDYVFTRANDQLALELTVSLREKSAAFHLVAKFLQSPGPFEYALDIPLKSLSVTNDTPVLASDGGSPVEIFPDERFSPFCCRELSFDLPEANFTLRTRTKGVSFFLQDRRAALKGSVHYVTTRTIDKPQTVVYDHEWTVKDGFTADELVGRREALARPLVVKVPVAVPDSGFEEGWGKWSHAANMTLDESVRHSGKASARITNVGGPGDHAYITCQVPVTSGSLYRGSCFLKTTNVTEAVVEKRESVGAGLIVEWCDKDGRWMQGGDYAANRFGSQDWKSVHTKWIPAPPGAGYATVYLTLRGKGTAWFDDVAFERRDQIVGKLEPAANAHLATSCPAFSWRRVHGTRRYTLELSQDPHFPKDRTKVIAAGGLTHAQLEEPLAKGRWYWRVNGDAGVRSFWVDVERNRDTLAPILLTDAARVTSSDAAFEVQVREKSSVDPVVTFLGVTGRMVRADGKGCRTYSFAAPAAGWPKGLTRHALEAVDDAGNKSSVRLWLLNAPKPANATVIGPDGRFYEGGKRSFPLGIYEVKPGDMLKVRRVGFDVVHTYRWESDQDDVACRAYLDACWQAEELRAFIGFDRHALVVGEADHVAKRVGALADHPGLYCWYLFDEPELIGQFVAPDQLIAYADLIRKLDPYHVVVMSTWNKTMGEYRRSWDTHWTQAYGDPAGVIWQLDQHRGFLGDIPSPITLLVNSNDGALGKLRRQHKPVDPAAYSKDYDYLKSCAFLAFPENCNGIWWWWYAPETREYFTVAQTPKGWADLSRIVRELVELRPIADADGVFVTGRVGPKKEPVSWWAKTVNGVTTLVAVNTANKATAATLDIPGFGPKPLSFRPRETKVLKLQ